MKTTDVMIVGAGMAGASCAKVLADAGMSLQLLDKSRSVGGRLCTRRVALETTQTTLAFDHGAQYFTARDPRFSEFLRPLIADNTVQRWLPRLVSIERDGQQLPSTNPLERWVGVPSQNALVKSMLSAQTVSTGAQVAALQRESTGSRLWQALDSSGACLARAQQVLLCLPAPQVHALLQTSVHAPDVAAALAFVQHAQMQPSWALLLAFEHSLNLAWDAAFVNAGALRWISCDSSKPGRTAQPECWVVHASEPWSSAHLEASAEDVAEALETEFRQLTASKAKTFFRTAHRWRYALGGATQGASHYYNAHARLGTAGDWCLGGRVEGAFLSGLELGQTVVETVL